jgi:hypothetical protein
LDVRAVFAVLSFSSLQPCSLFYFLIPYLTYRNCRPGKLIASKALAEECSGALPKGEGGGVNTVMAEDNAGDGIPLDTNALVR